jgi:two-component system, NarL family, nitrate/nitrite response regulator NarL
MRSNRCALTKMGEGSSLLSEMNQSTVLVADPFPLFREAVCRAIRQDRELRLVAEVADGRSALRDIEAHRPDVAVLGVPLGDIAAERVTDAVMRDGLATRVVLVLTHDDATTAFGALAHGASVCVTRRIEPPVLVRSVGAALRGEIVVAPELQTGVAREIRRRNPNGGLVLSVREREVLGHIADGRATPDIARALRIRESTVKTHVANAAEKLGASTRAAAVATAIRIGALD